MSLRQKSLYTLVFSIYCLIFSIIAYFLIERLFPGYLPAPDQLTTDYVTRATATFTIIVLLSFMGASYTVFGQLRNPADYNRRTDRSSRSFFRSRSTRGASQSNAYGRGRRRPAPPRSPRRRPGPTNRPARTEPVRESSRRPRPAAFRANQEAMADDRPAHTERPARKKHPRRKPGDGNRRPRGRRPGT